MSVAMATSRPSPLPTPPPHQPSLARRVAPPPPQLRRPSSASTVSRASPFPTPIPSASSSASIPAASAVTANPTSTSSPNTAGSSKDTSSSAGKVFAKPSKEWVLPERAKPGRKASTDEPESRRQSQNRLSQRAHRARRTDYIQTLEERLRQYEADEIHSNVRLQEVARALKADNVKMKNEVNALQATVTTHQAERVAWATERKEMKTIVATLKAEVEMLRTKMKEPITRLPSISKWEDAGAVRMDTISPRLSPVLLHPRTPDGLGSSKLAGIGIGPVVNTIPRRTTPPRPASRPVIACPICPDPDPDCPCQQRQPTSASAAVSSLESTLAAAGGCGLCESPDDCLCSTIGTDDLSAHVPLASGSHHDHDLHSDLDIKEVISSPEIETSCGLCTSASFCACKAGTEKDNLYSPPQVSKSTRAALKSTASSQSLSVQISTASASVPLRLRKRSTQENRPSLWALDNVASSRRQEAVCTGDPSNCDACRDDKFGQEFCGHLFKAASRAASPEDVKPIIPISSESPPPPAPLQMACCGAPELCGHKNGGCSGEVIGLNGDPSTLAPPQPRETMPPNEAWKTLKAHPNHKFTPLAILADVVARRTKCLGPRVELSPEPSSPNVRMALPSSALGGSGSNHALSSSASGAASAKRRLEVETSAVRDALKLLDNATPTPSPAPGHDREGVPKRMRLE